MYIYVRIGLTRAYLAGLRVNPEPLPVVYIYGGSSTRGGMRLHLALSAAGETSHNFPNPIN